MRVYCGNSLSLHRPPSKTRLVSEYEPLLYPLLGLWTPLPVPRLTALPPPFLAEPNAGNHKPCYHPFIRQNGHSPFKILKLYPFFLTHRAEGVGRPQNAGKCEKTSLDCYYVIMFTTHRHFYVQLEQTTLRQLVM